MTSMLKKLGTCSVVALVAAVSTPAMAAGTASGTVVNNTASVSYSVGGTAQTAVNSNQNQFTVDQKVNVVVAEVGNAATSVAPGSTGAIGTQTNVTTFTVTNTSNATLDFLLSTAQVAGGPGAHGGTDTFDVLAPRFYVESDGVAGASAGDTLVTYLDELGADQTRTVYVVVNVPTPPPALPTGSVANIDLIATAANGGTSGSAGTALVATTGANTNGVDIVFADALGSASGDIARDGKHSARDDYIVSAAALTVVKYNRVLWDPINGISDPKMIPGAVVQYCIAVSNAAGGATATNVTVNDTLPTEVSGTLPATPGYTPPVPTVNGSGTTSTCSYTGGAPGGSMTPTTATGPLNDVTPGSTLTFTFPVVVL